MSWAFDDVNYKRVNRLIQTIDGAYAAVTDNSALFNRLEILVRIADPRAAYDLWDDFDHKCSGAIFPSREDPTIERWHAIHQEMKLSVRIDNGTVYQMPSQYYRVAVSGSTDDVRAYTLIAAVFRYLADAAKVENGDWRKVDIAQATLKLPSLSKRRKYNLRVLNEVTLGSVYKAIFQRGREFKHLHNKYVQLRGIRAGIHDEQELIYGIRNLTRFPERQANDYLQLLQRKVDGLWEQVHAAITRYEFTEAEFRRIYKHAYPSELDLTHSLIS